MALIPMPATEAGWHALRAKHVGGSEIAALFDAQPGYALSHYALWHVKAGRAPRPEVDNERVTWGKRLEEVIALAVAEDHDMTISRGHYAICDDCPGLGASLDMEVAADPLGEFEGPGVLECKNVDGIIHKRAWTDDEPPLHILLQLQSQLAASGFKWGAVGALVGGHTPRLYRYPAKPRLIADMKRRVTGFWQSIKANHPPPVDGSDAAEDVLRHLHATLKDEVLDMSGSNSWPDMVSRFLEAAAAQKAAKESYDLAKNQIADALGDYKRGSGGGYSVTVSVTPPKEARLPKPDEMIGGRKESRRFTAKALETAS